MKRWILLALLACIALPASAQTRIVVPGGSYIEALPLGAYAALRADKFIQTATGLLSGPPGGILYQRITEANGVLEIAGQAAHGDGQVVFWDGTRWNLSQAGIAYGVSTAAYWPDGRLEVSTIEKRYGSQGIRYVTDRVYTGDETYGNPALGLSEFTIHGDIAVGQGAQTGGVVIVRGAQRKRLADGLCFFVRFNRAGNALAVAWWEAVGGGATNAHAVWLTVDQIGALPDEVVPAPVPVPVPPPTPIPDPVPPRGPPVEQESLFGIVEAVWTKYRGEDRGAMVNEIAWRGNGGKADGPWGLSRKTGGAHVLQPRTGERIAHDIVQHIDGSLYDVFSDAGPIWGQAHPHNDPSRIWLPAVAPDGVTPDPVKPPPTDPRLAELERKLAEVEIALASALRESEQRRVRVEWLEAERDDLKRQLDEARAERDAATADRDAQIAAAVDAALAKARCTASIFGIKIPCKVIR